MALPQAVEEQEKLAEELMNPTPPEPDEIEEAAPETEPEPRKRIDPEDYKERYTSLRAHRDAELVSAQRERDAMALKIEAQNRERNALLARMADMDQAAQRNQGLPKDVLSDEEIELVGEDAIPALTKVARAVAEQQTSRLNRQVDGLTNALRQRDQQAQQSEQNAYNIGIKERVIAAVPNAEQIDNDPAFHAWLDQPDRLSGMTRRDLAASAWANQDVGRVASMYSDWQAEMGGQQARPDPRAGKIMPGRVADRSRTSPEKRQWTNESIGEFYDAWRRGKYKDADAKALENDIFAAQREGRIR